MFLTLLTTVILNVAIFVFVPENVRNLLAIILVLSKVTKQITVGYVDNNSQKMVITSPFLGKYALARESKLMYIHLQPAFI